MWRFRSRWATTLVITVTLLAGCVSSPRDDGTEPVAPVWKPLPPGTSLSNARDASFAADWAEHAIPEGKRHDHDLPHHHAHLSTPNFEEVGHSYLLDVGPASDRVTRFYCGDGAERPDGRRLAVVTDHAGDAPPIVIVDATDPTAPFAVGWFEIDGLSYDVAMTPDGAHLVVAFWGVLPASSVDADADPPILAYRSACTGERAWSKARRFASYRSIRTASPWWASRTRPTLC